MILKHIETSDSVKWVQSTGPLLFPKQCTKEGFTFSGAV